jgi:hypothetical protein
LNLGVREADGVPVAVPPTTTARVDLGSDLESVAERLVASGRIVPGLTVSEDGRARSWWWPLPSAADRAVLVGLLDGNEPADHQRLASELGLAVDRQVRARLGAAGVVTGSRPGRRTVPDAWLRSLHAADPWLPETLDTGRVVALAAAVDAWIRSGVVGLGRARLCLRVHEPGAVGAGWGVEALAQDVDETSLLVPLEEVWEGRSPFGADVLEGVLRSLGHMARVAPELAGLLDREVPGTLELGDGQVVSLLHERVGPLQEAGIGVRFRRRGGLHLGGRAR